SRRGRSATRRGEGDYLWLSQTAPPIIWRTRNLIPGGPPITAAPRYPSTPATHRAFLNLRPYHSLSRRKTRNRRIAMSDKLAGKVAVVTGASKGIGAAIAQGLAA